MTTKQPELKGSKEARRIAAVVLEALGGLRSAQQAADALEIAVARYYVLERRAVQGMIEALERRPQGRRRSLEAELELRTREVDSLEQELSRYQALYRASQRTIGVPSDEPRSRTAKRKTKTTRVRQRKSRAEKVLSTLKKDAPRASAGSDAPTSTQVEEA